MADTLGAAPPDKEGKPLVQRFGRLVVVVVGCLVIYHVFGEMIFGLITTARNSRVTGDLKTIAEALDRYHLNKGKPFLDSDLDKLQGTTLQNVPRDPDGRPYVYDWFYGKLIYVGADGVLQTSVPGQPPPPEGDSDDLVYSLHAIDRIVYAMQEDKVAHLQVAGTDGSGVRQLIDVEGEVLSIGGLPLKQADLVALGVKKDGASRIDVVNVDEDPPKPISVTSSGEWPTLYDPKTEWLFFQAPGAGGRSEICKTNYKDRMVARLTASDSDCVQPGVELRNRWVWYSGRKKGGYFSLYRFQLTSYADAQNALSRAGVDLKAPAPSPTGDWLAYLVVSGGTTVIEVMNSKTKQMVYRSTEPIWPQTRIVWSPDDQKIGYFSLVDGVPRITLTHVEKKVTVTLPQFTASAFTWLSD